MCFFYFINIGWDQRYKRYICIIIPSMLLSDIHDFGILRCCHILTVTIFYFSSFAFTHHFVCLVNPAHAEFLVGR
jgi:hypothetical protein